MVVVHTSEFVVMFVEGDCDCVRVFGVVGVRCGVTETKQQIRAELHWTLNNLLYTIFISHCKSLSKENIVFRGLVHI